MLKAGAEVANALLVDAVAHDHDEFKVADAPSVLLQSDLASHVLKAVGKVADAANCTIRLSKRLPQLVQES